MWISAANQGLPKYKPIAHELVQVATGQSNIHIDRLVYDQLIMCYQIAANLYVFAFIHKRADFLAYFN